jgi:hypothetical protein
VTDDLKRLLAAIERLESRFSGMEAKLGATATDMRRHFEIVGETMKHHGQLAAERLCGSKKR